MYSLENALPKVFCIAIIYLFLDKIDINCLQQFTAFKPLAHRPKPMLAKP